jgi:hypothetical protein
MSNIDKTLSDMEHIVTKTIDHLLQSDCKRKPIAWLQVLHLLIQDLSHDLEGTGQTKDHTDQLDNT